MFNKIYQLQKTIYQYMGSVWPSLQCISQCTWLSFFIWQSGRGHPISLSHFAESHIAEDKSCHFADFHFAENNFVLLLKRKTRNKESLQKCGDSLGHPIHVLSLKTLWRSPCLLNTRIKYSKRAGGEEDPV